MFVRNLIAAVALSAAVISPAISQAAEASTARAPCILNQYRIGSVAPYNVEQHIGKNTLQSLRGAEIYVEAQPGLTAEWLQLNLSRHVTEMQGPATMRDCAFDLDSVHVDVSSAGSGFLVRLIAPDSKTGQEVLRRAQLLVS